MGWSAKALVLLTFFLGFTEAQASKRQWSHEADEAEISTELEVKASAPIAPEPSFLPPALSHILNSWNDFFKNLKYSNQITFGLSWNGAAPYYANETTETSPASTLKIVTATTALKTLRGGPDFRFSNSFEGKIDVNTGILYEPTFTVSGDPTWAHPDYNEDFYTRIDQVIAELQRKGVKEIRGTILFYITSSKVMNYVRPKRWKNSWATACYAGMVTPVILNGNCADLKITSLTTAKWNTPGVSIPVNVKLSYRYASTKKEIAPKVSVTLDPVTGRVKSYTLTGAYALNQSVISLPAHQSEKWLANLLVSRLKQLKLLKQSNITYLSTPAPESVVKSASQDKVFVDLSSPPLKEIIGPFLQDSINIVGDRLYLASSEEIGAVDDADPAKYQLQNVVKDDVLNSRVAIYDGSGLIAADQISPLLMYKYLESLPLYEHFSDFYQALPVSGMSGTIKNRMAGPLTFGKIHAKSGTIDGVSALSGYYQKSENDLKPFVIITLSDLDPRTILRPMQDTIVTELVRVNP